MKNPLIRLLMVSALLFSVIWALKPRASAALLPTDSEVATIVLLLVGLIGIGPLLWSVPIPGDKDA